MSYEKQTWNKYDDLKTEEENIENGAVVTDNRMNHIEEGIYSHTIDISNPHKVTAAQVGLDKVDNVKQASKVEFDSHASDNSNPHKVTAAQIGLDKVDNIQQAAKTEFDSHVNNKANPHVVTASQVGAYSKSESDSKLTALENKSISNKGNLKNGDDLNDITATGFYRIGGFVGGTEILNVPTELSGVKFYAFVTVTEALQELTVYAPINSTTWTYSRSISGTTPTWSSWSKAVMADESGKVILKDFEVTTISETVNIGNGLSLNFQRKGEFVLVRFSGSLTAINSGTYFSSAVPAQWRPDGIKELIGHFASGALAFHVDLETDGRVKWWGASGATGAPRGTAMYFLK